jgi:Family of unknown function (DUF6074)
MTLDFEKVSRLIETMGEVIPFPFERQVGRIRADAVEVMKRPAAKRGWHVKRKSDELRAQLYLAGVDHDLVREAARDYRSALNHEIQKRVVLDYLFSGAEGAA